MLEAFTKGTSFASSSRTIVLCNGEHMTANLLRCPDGCTRLTRITMNSEKIVRFCSVSLSINYEIDMCSTSI